MHHHIRQAETLAKLLDSQFRIFGIRFGLDPILGLFPGLGDAVSFGLSAYIIWIARSIGAPPDILRQMVVNIILDFVLGLFPVIGDVGDVFFRANMRNMALLRSWIDSHA